MTEQTIMVWDLESIPDLKAASRMLSMPDASENDVRESLGEGFPKHPLHQIVCIGALVATRAPEGWQVEALGAPSIAQRTEPELIAAFVEKIAQLCPVLVGFNCHSFDLPVLRYRAMVNRIPAPGLHVRPYFHRFTSDAVDLCDVLGSFTPGSKAKLDEVAKILGLGGKPEGIDGSQVEDMVKAGRIDEVALYCESDVLNTFRIWLIHELFRGAISRAELEWSEEQLRIFVRGRRFSNPHLIIGLGLDNEPHGGEGDGVVAF
jgi:predicted PolB exonuclease-like 3'-5' exonuclease